MRKNRVTLKCEHCNREVEVIKAREHTFRFCSQRCHGFGVLAKMDQSKYTRMRGEKNVNWKGGVRKHSNGYRWILVDGKYILEHRHVMSQYLGRPLSRRENVHHINGDKLDNRLENLEMLDVAEHTRLHSRKG